MEQAMTACRRALSGLVWYARALLGEDAYEHYIAYHRKSGCHSAPMTEKEFWRDRMDRQDKNPEGRCC
jgi:uncharacterized short protein YbdD (DUF466 family)